MWQKFRKREEAIKVYYKDKGEPARDHLPRTAVDGVISWEPVSMHWNIILSLHLETMPCWVWLQVCQRKERSCQDVIIPPHPTPPPRIWRRCHVECGRKCDADVGFWVMRMVVGEWPFFGCEILLFWLRNRLFLVAESSFFGCGIGYFWLRNRFFFGCGSAFFWLRKRVWFWLRNRRNLVAEASKYGFGIGIYSDKPMAHGPWSPTSATLHSDLSWMHSLSLGPGVRLLGMGRRSLKLSLAGQNIREV